MNNHHFLLISLPAQGHINPTLQLAKNLARAGARVTFTTTIYGLRQLKTLPCFDGLTYASISDGYDSDNSMIKTPGYLANLKLVGSQNLTNLLHKLSAEDHRPVNFLIYTILLPWVAEVAREMHLPSAFLAIQSATCFSIYYRFFNIHDGIYSTNKDIDPSMSLELPGLPLLTYNDIPSFLLPTNPYHSTMVPIMQEHIQTLEKDPNPCVLANTFYALEEISIKTIPNLNFISVGPLIPSYFTDGKDQSDNSFGCDLFQSSSEINYLGWLDSKPRQSVIYVSFGSLVVLPKRQKEELLEGLVENGRPFLWVLRDCENEEDECFKGTKIENGMIVPWCSQVEVLCHPSIGCFVTHCGWNSVVESIAAGVPMVGCPQFSDQITNAKMVEDVWRNGLRAVFDDDRVVRKEELKRCIDTVMGGGDEMRNNAEKWRDLAMEAVKESGSTFRNLKQFLEMMK